MSSIFLFEDFSKRKPYKVDHKKVTLYMDIAHRVALESYCVRKKVGCVLVTSDMGGILDIGYNGTISGFPNVCELPDGTTNNNIVLHAETNAIMKVARSNESTNGSILFTTLSPCVECCKLIIQAGIRTVVYDELYKNDDGLMVLSKSGVNVVKYIKGETSHYFGGSQNENYIKNK